MHPSPPPPRLPMALGVDSTVAMPTTIVTYYLAWDWDSSYCTAALAEGPILATSSQVPQPGATSHGSVKASANSAPCSQLRFASIAWPASRLFGPFRPSLEPIILQ
jgi:hypothetical protein